VSVRCPRCGTPADAVEVRFLVAPAAARRLREHLEIVRRETAAPTDGDALADAVARRALDLNQSR
jgi:hypothetical protein